MIICCEDGDYDVSSLTWKFHLGAWFSRGEMPYQSSIKFYHIWKKIEHPLSMAGVYYVCNLNLIELHTSKIIDDRCDGRNAKTSPIYKSRDNCLQFAYNANTNHVDWLQFSLFIFIVTVFLLLFAITLCARLLAFLSVFQRQSWREKVQQTDKY